MVDFSNIYLEKLAIHKVGNPTQEIENFVSNDLFKPTDDLRETLLTYFLKSFKKTDTIYQLLHQPEEKENPLYLAAESLFSVPERLLEESEKILHHLFAQSNHPNIKIGELFVCYFSSILIEDQLVDGIGIFKAETKNSYLQVTEKGEVLDVSHHLGSNVEKLDKGCLILNMEKQDGYRVLSVDNNAYDTAYWLYDFLNVDQVKNGSFYTKSYLELVDNFSNEIIAPETDKQEQMKFLSDSVEYFATHETFDIDEFTEKVIPHNEKRAAEFKSFQQEVIPESADTFTISKDTFKSASKKIKNIIKLDTKIQIKLDLNDPAACDKFIEKHYDDTRKMYYYKVYFNEELS